MSFQQDYLLRMIQDVGAFMTRIVRMRRENRGDEAITLLADESTRLSGIPASLVYALSDDDLIDTLQARGAVEPERCYAIAELFRTEGEIYDDAGNPEEAHLRLSKAARLHAEALTRDEREDEKVGLEGLRDTLRRVDASSLPIKTVDLILLASIEREAYDLTDNVLYELLLDEDQIPDHRFRAEQAYRQILAASDYALSRANLARDEIEQSLAALDEETVWK